MRKRVRGRHAEGGDDGLIEQFFGDVSDDSARRHSAERREKQLCREVYRVLVESVTCAEIVEVRPAPDSSRLAVAVRLWPGDDEAAILERLGRAKGDLREEMAAALQRKRTPDLFFEVVP